MDSSSGKKIPVEACLRLDLRQFAWGGAMQAQRRTTGALYWPASTQRAQASMIGFAVDMHAPPHIQLAYGCQRWGAEGTPVEWVDSMVYAIALVATAQHYGGGQWWFQCPLALPDGAACTRRARVLYLPPAGTCFGCVRCHGLSYTSRQDRLASVVREWPALTVEYSDVHEARLWRKVLAFAGDLESPL